MRHFLLASALLLLAQESVLAQFNEGDLMISVGGSYKSKEYSLKETLDSEIDLQLGYYPIPRVGVGLVGNWGLSRFSYAETQSSGATSMNFKEGHWGGIGPYVRGHLGHPDFSVFGQLSAVFGTVDQDLENNLSGTYAAAKQQGSFQQYSFAFGAWWYFTRRFGAEVLGSADWVNAQIQYGTVGADGEVTYDPTSHHDGSGGGFSLRLIYWFRLDKGAKKPDQPGG